MILLDWVGCRQDKLLTYKHQSKLGTYRFSINEEREIETTIETFRMSRKSNYYKSTREKVGFKRKQALKTT